jgi:hypothetical protein
MSVNPTWEPDIGDEITCVTEGVDEWADGRVGVVMDEHAFFKSTWWVAVEQPSGVSTVIALGLDQMEPTP